MKLIKKIAAVVLCVALMFTCFPLSVFAKASDSENKKEANIVLFGYFNNYTADEANEYYKTNLASIMKIIDGSNGRSFKNYIKSISYGKLEIENIFPQYSDGNIIPVNVGVSEDDANVLNYDVSVIDALVSNMPSIADKIVDKDGDGYVDNVMLIVMNKTNEAVSGTTLVPHKGDYTGSTEINNKKIGTYNMFGTYRLLNEKTGLVAHEFLHTLGYADLYKNTTSQYPVYVWSIMGGPSQYPQYPLAYERMYFTHWLDIDEITESTTLTLDTQSNANGNQAYAIKSPFNDRELFVVEYRERPNRYVAGDEDSLDYSIGGSGVIVYRVNLSVEGLSNLGTENGIYLFRPQENQPGYSKYETTSIYNAYLPYNSYDGKRNSIGTGDMSKTLADGALTFDNGSNSGIVIENVKLSSDAKQATLDVTVPQKEDFDLWEDTGFGNETSTYGKYINMQSSSNGVYTMSFENNKIYSKKYNNGAWSNFAPSIDAMYATNICSAEKDGVLYLAFFAYENNADCVKFYKFDTKSDTSWTLIKSISGIMNYGLTLGAANGDIYAAYTGAGTWQSYPLMLGKISEGNVSFEKVNISGNAMRPKVTGFNGDITVSYKNNSNQIVVGKYKDGTFEQINSVASGSGYYDLKTIGSKLYLAYSPSDTRIAEYDGTSWSDISVDTNSAFDVGLSDVNGKCYLHTAVQTPSKTAIYLYENGQLTQEGENVDVYADSVSLAQSNGTIYAGYSRNDSNGSALFVKKKAINMTQTPVDTAAFDSAVSVAKQHLTEDYSKETLGVLQALCDKYDGAFAEGSSQSEIDKATAEILEAVSALKAYFFARVSAENGTVTANVNSVSMSKGDFTVLYGDEVTVSADTGDDCGFVGWYDNNSSRYLSSDLVYSFIASSNIDLKAVFTKAGYATLTFTNHAGSVWQKNTMSTSAWSGISDIGALVPDVPYRYGYSNGRWNYDSVGVLTKLRSGENVTIAPIYDNDNKLIPSSPKLNGADAALELYYDYDKNNNVGSFIMTVSKREEITVESIGFALYHSAEFIPSEFDLRLNNKMKASAFSTSEIYDYYILNVPKFNSNENWAVRGYITYKDSKGAVKTVYSNQVNVVNATRV